MGTHKMIVSSPPFQMGQKLWGLLSRGPSATCQSCHPMTDGEIHPLDKSGVQPSREAHSLQGGFESGACSKAHYMRDPHQLTPTVAFFHLTVYQPCCYSPLAHFPLSAAHLKPLSKMGRQSIEIQI